MTDADAERDQLIARLMARAADPGRRADVIVDAFSAAVRTMDLGSLASMGRSVAADLGRLVGEIRATGAPGPGSRVAADAIAEQMATPATPSLPGPVSPASVAAVEAELGCRLPEALRRAYLEVADGGFGPGAGILSLEAALGVYRDLRAESPGPRGSAWPGGLLPVVDMNPGYDCVEVSSGRVVAWDPEDLRERSSQAVWERSFREIAPSVDAWLSAWVDSRTPAEQASERLAGTMVEEARRARQALRDKGLDYRRSMGLPDVGWERVVWGGIGYEEDEEHGEPD